MARGDSEKYELSDGEKRDLIRSIERERSLADNYRLVSFTGSNHSLGHCNSFARPRLWFDPLPKCSRTRRKVVAQHKWTSYAL